MNDILLLADKLERLVKRQEQQAEEIVNENNHIIEDMVTAQMDNHTDGDNNPISPQYSPAYAAFKGFSTPDLKLTGAFHQSVFANAQKGGVGIGDTDEKTDHLIEKYGESVLKLSDQNANEFNEGYLLPEMLAKNESALL